MNIEYRIATIKDLAIVQELNNKLFILETEKHDPHLVKDWPFSDAGTKYFESIVKDGFVIIAFDGKTPIGYLAGAKSKAYSYSNLIVAELDNMFVEQEYRGHGVGKLLFQQFKDWVKAQDISRIKVSAYAKNKSALAFYRSVGFEDFAIHLHCKVVAQKT